MKIYLFQGTYIEMDFEMIHDYFPVVPHLGMTGVFTGMHSTMNLLGSSRFLNGEEIDVYGKTLLGKYWFHVLGLEESKVV